MLLASLAHVTEGLGLNAVAYSKNGISQIILLGTRRITISVSE
jgi:hypothetical protein